MLRAFIIGCLTICVLLPTTTHAQTHHDEINAYVIDPCILASVRHQNLDEEMGEERAVQIMKMLMADGIRQMVDGISTMVEGKARSERMRLYPMLLGLCLEGVMSGGN